MPNTEKFKQKKKSATKGIFNEENSLLSASDKNTSYIETQRFLPPSSWLWPILIQAQYSVKPGSHQMQCKKTNTAFSST